jgi:hypothetical protein
MHFATRVRTWRERWTNNQRTFQKLRKHIPAAKNTQVHNRKTVFSMWSVPRGYIASIITVGEQASKQENESSHHQYFPLLQVVTRLDYLPTLKMEVV